MPVNCKKLDHLPCLLVYEKVVIGRCRNTAAGYSVSALTARQQHVLWLLMECRSGVVAGINYRARTISGLPGAVRA